MPKKKTKQPTLPTPSEHDYQCNVIQWKNSSLGLYPELRALFAIPNGGGRPKMIDAHGNWFSPTANKLKKEGLVAGVPDLLLALARCGFHSLYVEMKKPGGTVSKEQREFQELLKSHGMCVFTCYNDMDAIAVITAYLHGKVETIKL